MIARIFLVLVGCLLFMIGNAYMHMAEQRRHDHMRPTIVGAVMMVIGCLAFIKAVWP